MSKTTIEWTDETWNPVTGCDRISPGCLHCYAKTLHDRRHKAWIDGRWPGAPFQYNMPFEVVTCHPDRLDILPLGGKPRKVFVNSMSDLFHQDVPFEFIDKVFAAMALRPHMTFQILTKRPDRMCAYFDDDPARDVMIAAAWKGGPEKYSWPLPNVWLGVSTENQKTYDERSPWLKKTPAAVRFLSIEPMLGPIAMNLDHRSFGEDGERDIIDWVIVGGESGPGARRMDIEWARGIRSQCMANGIPFFFKQWGPAGAGNTLDGRKHLEFPEVTGALR